MTKTLSKSKSNHGSKHGGMRRGKDIHVTKEGSYVLWQSKENGTMRWISMVYVVDESI